MFKKASDLAIALRALFDTHLEVNAQDDVTVTNDPDDGTAYERFYVRAQDGQQYLVQVTPIGLKPPVCAWPECFVPTPRGVDYCPKHDHCDHDSLQVGEKCWFCGATLIERGQIDIEKLRRRLSGQDQPLALFIHSQEELAYGVRRDGEGRQWLWREHPVLALFCDGCGQKVPSYWHRHPFTVRCANCVDLRSV